MDSRAGRSHHFRFTLNGRFVMWRSLILMIIDEAFPAQAVPPGHLRLAMPVEFFSDATVALPTLRYRSGQLTTTVRVKLPRSRTARQHKEWWSFVWSVV